MLLRPLLFLLCACLVPFSLAAETAGAKRDYWRALTPDEEQNLRFMVHSLGRKSKLSLLFSRSKLQRAGEATGKLHPLRFLAYVREDPELYQSFQQMRGRVWREFSDGFSESFNAAADRGNFDEKILSDFAQLSQILVDDLSRMVAERRWNELMQRFRG